jgi:hypothetical protein
LPKGETEGSKLFDFVAEQGGAARHSSLLSKPWRSAPLYRQERFYLWEDFSLDCRGWKAAPTEKGQLT